MWLHLDGEAITEARHCVICQPHGHVIDAACADCGDGPLITGQPPGLGDHPAGPALNWLRQHGWQTYPGLLCPAHAHLSPTARSFAAGDSFLTDTPSRGTGRAGPALS